MAYYLNNTYWKTFRYGAAGMAALSGIYHNQHWDSDVFRASVIGYIVSEFVVGLIKIPN